MKRREGAGACEAPLPDLRPAHACEACCARLRSRALASRRFNAAFRGAEDKLPSQAPGPRLRTEANRASAVQQSSLRTDHSVRRAGSRGLPGAWLTRPNPQAPHPTPPTCVS